MDTELRRRFLQLLGFDFAKLDLAEAGIRLMDPRPNGPSYWPVLRAWRRGDA